MGVVPDCIASLKSIVLIDDHDKDPASDMLTGTCIGNADAIADARVIADLEEVHQNRRTA